MSPFVAPTADEIVANNMKCIIDFPVDLWSGVSQEGQELVKLMTLKDQKERISVDDALKHPWFALKAKNKISLSSAVANMKKYYRE